ncbi:hypothetical protein ACHWUR_00435 [Klebsiella pneumoniae]
MSVKCPLPPSGLFCHGRSRGAIPRTGSRTGCVSAGAAVATTDFLSVCLRAAYR